MDAIKTSTESAPDYPVICRGVNPDINKIIELSSILDHWYLYENNSDDPLLNTRLSSACTGSSFGGASPRLTMGQLFSVWRSGRLIHSAYFYNDGAVVHEDVYQVGAGFALSGSYVFWGIVPSRKIIVLSNRSPNGGIGNLISNMRIYKDAVRPPIQYLSEAEEITERTWMGLHDFRGSIFCHR